MGSKLTKNAKNQGRSLLLDSSLWSALGWGQPAMRWTRRIRGNEKETDMLWRPGTAWSDGSE